MLHEDQTHKPGTACTIDISLEAETEARSEEIYRMFIQEQILRHMQRSIGL